MRDVFVGTFTSKVLAQQDAECESGNADPLDELALDESKHYKQKISRYIKNSLTCVSDPAYWFILWTSNHTRKPLLHFYRFLCVKHTSTRLHVVELVGQRLDLVMAEFNQLVASFDSWIDAAFTFMSLENRSEMALDDLLASASCTQETLHAVAASLLLHNAAAFERRVSRYYQRCFS